MMIRGPFRPDGPLHRLLSGQSSRQCVNGIRKAGEVTKLRIAKRARTAAVYRNGELRRQFDKYRRRRPPPSEATAVGSPLPRPEERSAGMPIGAGAGAEHEQTETGSLD